MEEMLTGQDHAVIMICCHETYSATTWICLYLPPFCKIDQEEGWKDLCQDFLDDVQPPQHRVGDSDEYKVETAEVEDKGVEEDGFVRPIFDELDDCEGWDAPDEQ